MHTPDTQSSSLIIPDVPSAYFLDTDPFDSFYISQRYLLLAIEQFLGGEDVMITVYDSKESREIFANYKKVFGDIIESMHIIWIPENYYKIVEYLAGENIDWKEYLSSHGMVIETTDEKQHFSVMRQIIRVRQQCVGSLNIRGYKVTSELLKLAKKICSKSMSVIISGEQDTQKEYLKYGKAILYEDLEGKRLFDFSEEILAHIPEGRVVSEKEGSTGLDHAINEILSSNNSIKRVLIKPLNASSGEGIVFISIAEKEKIINSYGFEYGDVVVEECLELMKLSDLRIHGYGDDPMSLSVQYYDGQISGKPVVQLTKDNEFQGNILLSEDDIRNLGLPEEIFEQVYSYSERLISELGLEGNGGFDFLFDLDGKFYFIDPNIGRDTGALPVRLFEKVFLKEKSDQTSVFSKINAENIFDLEKLMEILERRSIPLISKGDSKGVLPISFVAGEHFTVIVSGDSYNEVDDLLVEIKTIVSNETIGIRETKKRLIRTAGVDSMYDSIHKEVRG